MRTTLPLLLLVLIAASARAETRLSLPAAEVVVTATAGGEVLVGVGEPPTEAQLPALVYLEQGAADLVRSIAALRDALGGSPVLRRYAAPDAPGVEALDRTLAATGLAVEPVDPPAEGTVPTTQMTADAGGFHRRDAPGHPAPDAASAVRQLIEVSSYGHGHGQPLFQPAGDGSMTQLRAADWDRETQAYACPFPATPALTGPAGVALEISLADGRSASEEALASWCDRSARALASSCGADEVIDAFEMGVVESAYGDPPGPGPWWLRPGHVAPSGASSMPQACAADALSSLEIAATHAGVTLRYNLIEDDLSEGCRREIDEACK